MKKFLKKLSEFLFLYHRFQIKTKLPKNELLKRMDLLLQVNDFDYYGMIKDDGFFIGARNWKVYLGGSSQNSFAPVAVGKITTENGVTTLSVTIRMNIIIQVIFVPIHIMTLCTVLLIPFFWLLLYFAFVKPAKRLRDGIKAEIYYDEVIK